MKNTALVGWIESFEEFPCVPVDSNLVRNGAEYASRSQISYWDSAVVAATQQLQAKVLCIGSLSHDHLYGAAGVVNSFRPPSPA